MSNESGDIFEMSSLFRGTAGSLRLAEGVKLEVSGEFQSTGDLQLTLDGRPATDRFAAVVSTGPMTIGGGLQVDASSTLATESGDAYRLLSGAGISNTFDSVSARGFETLQDQDAFFAFADRAPQIDLFVREVSAPVDALVGEQVEIQWTVSNAGSDPAVGPWYDEIRLRPDRFVSDDVEQGNEQHDVIVGGVTVGQGLTLLPGESTTFSTTVTVAPGVLDDYRWMVRTNRRANVLEAEGRRNNDGFGAETFSLDFRELTIDAPGLTGQFSGRREPLYFKSVVPAGSDVGIELQMSGQGNSVNELFVSRDYISSRTRFQASQSQRGQADVSVAVPAATATSVVYVTVLPASFDAGNVDFELSAATLPAAITAVAPDVIGNTGVVTLELSGERLSDSTTFALVGDDDRILPISVHVLGRTNATARFEFSGIATGQYDVEVSDASGLLSTLENAVIVEAANQGSVEVQLLGSSRVRSGRTVRYSVDYHNTSNVDMHLPFITARVSGGGALIPRYDSEIRSPELVMLAPPVSPGSATMPPDSRGTLTFFYEVPLDEGNFEVEVWSDTIDDSDFREVPLDWNRYQDTLRPSDAVEDSWQSFLAGERSRYGETIRDLFAFLEHQIVEFGQDGFDNILFVNGQWLFELPESDSGAERGLSAASDLSRGPTIQNATSDGPPVERFGVFQVRFGSGVAEGETNGDGRQDVYAVVVGNPTGDLPGSEVDGQSWNNTFTKTFNLEGRDGDDPHVFSSINRSRTEDDNVSATKFLQDLESVQSKADDDDLIFVTYAGHGFCRTLEDGSTGGELDFEDRNVTGAELQTALQGRTRTVAIFDSCHAAALTSEITAPNVTTVAGSDGIQKLDDDNSFSKHLIPLIQQNPEREIHDAIRAAGQKQFEKERRFFHPGSRERAETAISDLRQSKVDRTATLEETEAFLTAQGPKILQEIDSDGDGSVDAYRLPPGEGQAEGVLIPDYYEDGFLDMRDFDTSQHGGPPPSVDGVRMMRPAPEVNLEDLSPAQLAQYQAFNEYKANIEASRGGYQSIAFPVLDARGGDLTLDGVDIKKPGGTSTTVTDEQQKKEPRDRVRGERGRSFDPNEKVGPAGFGPQGFLQNGLRLPFAVYFENDPERATLAAQEVRITEVLDSDLDLSTFELGDIVVGDRLINVPNGRTAWATVVPIVVDGHELDLSIDAELDFITRTVTWKFESIDPITGTLTEVFEAGFLPINDSDGRGEGHVNYSIRPLAGLPTGTEISGAAEIVFDLNDPLITNSTLNTIDIDAPTGMVNPLPTHSLPSFVVDWSGEDGIGSGAVSFDVLVAVDGGAFEPWLNNIPARSATFLGEVGSTYSFHVVTRDGVGLEEPAKQVIEASTTIIQSTWTNPTNRFDVNSVDGVSALDALLVINELGLRSEGGPDAFVLDPREPGETLPPFFDVTQNGRLSALDALQVINEIALQLSGQAGGEAEFVDNVLGIPQTDDDAAETIESETRIELPGRRTAIEDATIDTGGDWNTAAVDDSLTRFDDRETFSPEHQSSVDETLTLLADQSMFPRRQRSM